MTALEQAQRKKQDCTVGDRELLLEKATMGSANYNTNPQPYSLPTKSIHLHNLQCLINSMIMDIEHDNVHLSHALYFNEAFISYL